MIAIITTSRQVFDNYRLQHNIDARHAKQIARMTDLDTTVYDKVIDLDPLQNVTEFVRDRIKSKVMEH